ncbi:MAG: GNAT family N-acetyltransferase [Bacillota bacterium]
MLKVRNKENYLHLFSNYTYNIPVIYSSMEGQYDGELYVDSVNNPQIAVLFTPFAFHFVTGDAEADNIVDILDDIIFKQYISQTNQKEAVVFAPDPKWDKVLNEVFTKYHGFKDRRKVFRLNKDKFNEIKTGRDGLDGIECKISYTQDGGAGKPYPISRIFIGGECVSFCSGFMLGKGHAEIDVATMEMHRGKGYAKEASIALINELLQKGIEPDWCTWPYRIESEKLALSLGFELADEIPAYIWVEDECGKIQ